MKVQAEQVIDVARVAFILAGGVALVRGAWLAWAPAGWLVAGLALVTVGLAGAVGRRGKE